MTIAIDFDGTCVKHMFPEIGEDIGAAPVLRELVDNGHKLVLFTMRSDVENPESADGDMHLQSGKYLSDAIDWFARNGIPLYGIQTNPTQNEWTTSPKAYANLYIDDAALGAPVIKNGCDYPYICWKTVRQMLIREGIIMLPEPSCYDT